MGSFLDEIALSSKGNLTLTHVTRVNRFGSEHRASYFDAQFPSYQLLSSFSLTDQKMDFISVPQTPLTYSVGHEGNK